MSDPRPDLRRSVPSVERVLHALPRSALPRAHVVATIREVVARARALGRPTTLEEIVVTVQEELRHLERLRLQVVINATGILLHTNFGRAPLSSASVEAVAAVAADYSNLEYDLQAAERGGRAAYLERSCALACGAEAATVVNNGAAALVLVLHHFTRERRQVIVSRGELVQIGGGFRIPDILEASGAELREVGTTNHTTVEDYERAISDQTALLLKVHRSNFFVGGFTHSPRTEELAGLAREHRLPLVEDLGSGAVFPTEQIPGAEHEPTIQEVLARGVDLVTFSGDKLLGGPQAGIIAGTGKAIAALKRDPLFRAFRCDKLVFAALQATVDTYLANTATDELPLQQMARCAVDRLRERAQLLAKAFDDLPLTARVVDVTDEFGGGSLPNTKLPGIALEVRPRGGGAARFAAALGRQAPPVIGRVAHDAVLLHLRTIFPRQDALVARACRAAGQELETKDSAKRAAASASSDASCSPERDRDAQPARIQS